MLRRRDGGRGARWWPGGDGRTEEHLLEAAELTLEGDDVWVGIRHHSGSRFARPEDIKTTLIYAKADAARLRDAVRSFEELGKNGYRMVTEGGDGNGRATHEV